MASRDSAWATVRGKPSRDVAARGGVLLFQSLVDETDHDVVTHETTGVDDLLRRPAERGALAHGGTQHVAGGDVRNHEVPRQPCALRALARTLASEHHHPCTGNHFLLPLPITRVTST